LSAAGFCGARQSPYESSWSVMPQRVRRVSRKRLYLRRVAWKRSWGRVSALLRESANDQQQPLQVEDLAADHAASTVCRPATPDRTKRKGGAGAGRSRKRRRLEFSGWDSIFMDDFGSLGLRRRSSLLGLGFPLEEFDTALPCGLNQTQVMDLMYRDIKPEDYEMLSKLDESVPKRDIVQRTLVDDLPRVLARDSGAKECGVCLAQLRSACQAVQLPCQHAFHPMCIEKWLTECKNTCPLCSTPIDVAKP